MRKKLIILLLFTVNYSFACSCIEENISFKKKIEKAYTNADVIFTGKVITIQQKKGSALLEVSFEVETFFKSKNSKKIIKIATEEKGTMCGYRFYIGKTYIVYANEIEIDREKNHLAATKKVPPYYITSICDRTTNIKSVKKCELRKLKRLTKKNKK